ncbi:MAG: response regulator [Anaerolineae bacterium]|nr:response regulator [Anaerolineae bacterium]
MIRIVVVDDSPEVVNDIERLFHFEPDLEVVGTATDGAVGLQVVRETRPDVVLLDINMPGMDGLAVAEAITANMPGVQVIMMSVQTEMDYLRKAMRAGARDYILKPFDIDEVPAKIRQVHESLRAKSEAAAVEDPTEGKVITVFSPRGGSGCTTLAVNLALALRSFTRRKVALVDAALQFGDVGVMLNVHNQRHIGELARHMDELDPTFVGEMTVTHPSGLRVLLAPPRPEMAELVTSECIRRTLASLKQSFDFVVVDGGHYLGESLLASVDESDRLLLLTTPDIPSIKSTRLMLEVLDALGVPEERCGLVIGQAGRRYGVKTEDIERSLGMRAVVALPYDDAGPLLAANQGRALYEMDPEAPFCQAVLKLSQEVIGGGVAAEGEPVAEEPAKPRRRFAFLGG